MAAKVWEIVNLPRLKPNCDRLYRLYLSMCVTMSCLAILSKCFAWWIVSAIGQLSSGLQVSSPGFSFGFSFGAMTACAFRLCSCVKGHPPDLHCWFGY